MKPVKGPRRKTTKGQNGHGALLLRGLNENTIRQFKAWCSLHDFKMYQKIEELMKQALKEKDVPCL